MIEKLIAFSARNAFIVVLLIVAIVGGGLWAIRATPIDAIPDLSDVQVIVSANWEGRSPTLVEDQVVYPIVTALISAPNVKVVRGFSYFDVGVRLRHLRGRDRPLLGPQPRPGVPERAAGPPARRRPAGPGARRHRRGLGLRVRPRRQERQARPLSTPHAQRLVRPVLAALRPRRGRGGSGRRLREAVPDRDRSQRAPLLQPPARPRGGQRPEEQQRRGRPRRRVDRPRVHGPRQGLHREGGGHRAGQPRRQAGRDARSSSRTSRACTSGRRCAGEWPS